MKKYLWLILISCCFVSSVNAEHLDLPLNKFGYSKVITLRCIAGSYTVQIPIPERWVLKKATLVMPYVNSSNLLMEKAQLVVKVNDYPVGQVRLSPLLTEGKMSVTIPPDIMPSGYNRLTFQVAQHFTKDCENPCAPDLWTSLYFEEGLLQLEYSLKPVPLRLSEVGNFLFDSKIFPQGEVNVITEGTSPDSVTVAGIAVSGVARRFNYRQVLFTTSKDVRSGMDNILIGREEFVEAFLRQKGISIGKVTGPFLKVAYLPAGKTEYGSFSAMAENFLKQQEIELNEKLKRFLKIPFISASAKAEQDPFHALLIVSGLNLDHVKIAAETLANMTFPYPGIDETTILEFNLPEIAMYSGKRVLQSDKIYKFKTLEFPTHTFEGLQPAPMEISFRLPADFLIKSNQVVKLNLNFAYGAGMRADSVLNIKLNGKHVRAISVGKTTGDTITGYKIELPTYLFKAGNNTLSFSPILTPIAKECDLIQLESLFLTIFENSTLYFPPMGHFVELPKIELFMLNGFPFTRWPDGYESLIYLTQNEDNTMAAAFNIIGLMTQKNGYPLFGIKITNVKPQKWDGELIVIGDIGTIPDFFKKAAPLKLLQESSVSYPVIANWEGEESFASTKQRTGFGSASGAIMEFESPYKKGRTVLMFTANSARDLLSFSHALQDPGVQSRCEGDLIMVGLTPPDFKVNALKIGKNYFSGKMGKISMIGVYLYTYPFLYNIAILLAIVILGLVIFFFLKRYKAMKKAAEAGEEIKDTKGWLPHIILAGFILRKLRKTPEAREGGKSGPDAGAGTGQKTEPVHKNKLAVFFGFIYRHIKRSGKKDEKKNDTKNN